jgi:GAF domain-containing protein
VTAIRWLKAIWQILAASPSSDGVSLSLDLVPESALVAYLEQNPEPTAADSPELPPGTSGLSGGVSLLVPLVSEGRLVGLLSLGLPHGSKMYSADELMFIATLADEAAAAARIAQLRSVRAGRPRSRKTRGA